LLKLDEQCDLNPVSYKIFNSYSGIFLWPLEILYGQSGLLRNFEGMHIYTIKRDKVQLKNWKDSLLQERYDAVFDIIRPIKEDPLNQKLIKENNPIGRLPFNWREFNHYHAHKTKKISTYLKDHLRDGAFYYQDIGSPEIYFAHKLEPRLIKILHKKGAIVARTSLLYATISELEKQCERRLDKKSSSNHITAHQWVSLTVQDRVTIKKIVKKILELEPRLNTLTISQAKYHIITKFRDHQGMEFNPDTIEKALRENNFS